MKIIGRIRDGGVTFKKVNGGRFVFLGNLRRHVHGYKLMGDAFWGGKHARCAMRDVKLQKRVGWVIEQVWAEGERERLVWKKYPACVIWCEGCGQVNGVVINRQGRFYFGV